MSGPAQMIGQVVLGRYRVVHGLARGGMGEIYLARSEGAAGFAKPVVVKRILAEFQTDDTVVQMFKREARIMSNLHHPNIVSVLDFGYEEGSYFMVLEYVHGLHAGRWKKFLHLTKRPFPVERAVQIVVNILEALHYAHTLADSEGRPLHIVHRDISPSNVLIDLDGHVKLADFGIARMQSSELEWKTQDLSVKGKFPYLPPEIFSGEKADARTDVYAAAVVLHELIAGVNEFRADNASASVAKVLGHIPRRLDRMRPDVPKGVADAVAKALEKKASDRYQSAQEFAAALRAGRALSSDEGAREIAAAARADFLDPRMPSLLGVEDLSTVERSWRNPSRIVPSVAAPAPTHVGAPAAPVSPERTSVVPTQIAPAGGLPTPTVVPLPQFASSNEGKGTRALLIGVALLAVVGIGIGGFALLRTQPAAPPQQVFVVDETVGRNTDPATNDVTPPPVVDPPTPVAPLVDASASSPPIPDPPPVKTVNSNGGSPPVVRTPRPQSLDEPFRRRASEIQACFARHVQQLDGAPRLTVRIELATSGVVQSATLEPAELGATPLGACVLGIARSTRFASQDAPVTFRLPLNVSARAQ